MLAAFKVALPPAHLLPAGPAAAGLPQGHLHACLPSAAGDPDTPPARAAVAAAVCQLHVQQVHAIWLRRCLPSLLFSCAGATTPTTKIQQSPDSPSTSGLHIVSFSHNRSNLLPLLMPARHTPPHLAFIQLEAFWVHVTWGSSSSSRGQHRRTQCTS